MPLLTEMLWNAVKEKQYDEVKKLVTEQEDLINGVHPTNGRSLVMHLIQSTDSRIAERPMSLIKFLLTHSKLDWNFKTRTKSSLQDTIVASALLDLSLLEGLKDVPAFITNRDKLTYGIAVAIRERLINYYQANIRKGASQLELDENQLSIKTMGEVMRGVLDLTIVHAYKTDDADLLERLKSAKADTSGFMGKLGDNKLPTSLLKPTNIKIKEWLAVQRKESLDKLATNENAFFANAQKAQDLQKQIDQVHAKYQTRATEILNRSAGDREDRMRAAVAQFS